MRFLADMGILMRTVTWLRSSGHDAVHLTEENLQRSDDEVVLAKARAEGRILSRWIWTLVIFGSQPRTSTERHFI